MPFPLASVGLAVSAFAAGALLGAVSGRSWLDGVFLGILLSFLVLLLQFAWGSSAQLLRTRRHEREVVAVRPDEVANRAVEEERARLSQEIDGFVRRSLDTVRALATEARGADDPRPALLEIQAESRRAMHELRRQLGLIGRPEAPKPMPADHGGPERADPRRGRRLTRSDAATFLAVLAVMVLDLGLGRVEVGRWPPPDQAAMSVLLAITVMWRRTVPVPAALAGTTVLLLGVVLDAPVLDGFSFGLLCGLLLWSVLVQPLTVSTVTAALALVLTAVGSRYAHEPANAQINLVILLVLGAVALAVGLARRARASSSGRTAVHEEQLASARLVAVADERRRIARELHDVASHAVSLVAVQAGAAELAWERDPASARATTTQILETVDAARAELGEQPWVSAAPLTWVDVERTVVRLREAGLDVALTAAGTPPTALLPTVHRLVQETLTNALRHAPGSRVTVRIVSDAGGTTVDVTDDGRTRPSDATSGYGLIGLADRVHAVGGTLTAGPAPGGGFIVHAQLPHAEAGGNTSPAHRHTPQRSAP